MLAGPRDAAPAIARYARLSGKPGAVPLFTGSYLAIWAIAGVVAFALALIGLGFVIVIAPSLIPGLTPPPM
jgi:predicted metal-binding membrane protein